MNTAAELIGFIVYLLQLFIWIIIIQAILSWLVAFNVVNLNNRFVHSVLTGLDRLLNPLLRPIRNLLPDMGGIDLALTGFEQVRSVVAAIAGDTAAAARVDLVLPDTGVCGGAGLFDAPAEESAGGSCCAPAPQLVQIGTASSTCC